MRTRTCLVWVRGPSGPQAQMWAPEAFEISQNRIDACVIAIYELTDDECRKPLDLLGKMHPAPRIVAS
jgi:hypothetical protein